MKRARAGRTMKTGTSNLLMPAEIIIRENRDFISPLIVVLFLDGILGPFWQEFAFSCR